MKPSITLMKIAGIEVGVHYTWLFALAFITWSLATSAYPELFPRWTERQYWTAGITSALVLFASVLVHEFAHSLVARRKGLPVRGITLFIFGGVSNLGADAKRAWDEFLIAVVGPLTSLVIGGLFFAVYVLFLDATDLERASPLQGVIFYSGLINLTVGIFNLVPGYPLDGGRVLRSIVWGVTQNVRTATSVASNVGRLVAWSMIAAGVYFVLQDNWLSGVWLIMIGFFLNNAAGSALREGQASEALSGATVRDVMQPQPVTVGPDMTVDELVREVVVRRGVRSAPVIDNGGLAGIVSLTDVRRLEAASWPTTPVSVVMTRPPLRLVAPGDPVETAFRLLADVDINQVIVVEGGQVVGLVRREDLLRFVRVRRESGFRDGRGAG